MSDFKVKMQQIRLQRSPDPLAGFRGPISKGREGRGGERRRGEEEMGRGGKERESPPGYYGFPRI